MKRKTTLACLVFELSVLDLVQKPNRQRVEPWESAHYKVVEPGVSKNQTGSNT